ncbi:three-Cys-motif partner protein TcmP [Bradyrhizobium elkanii]|uniref:three-Cys-motif partner protein TcmP n=1 Tax=Bradyrhizobium elkanii TaxID=29448 RepID=UPI0004B81883|nr:three-Cys-motif partner protein TcmP [Bradyrhizobium elkanii]
MTLLASSESDVSSLSMGQRFFDEREDQSEVKARIVSKYFVVWAKIIAPKARTKRIGYIDLFAGPGRYKDGSASTPLMVLQQAIADSELRENLVTYFNDEQPEHTKSLAAEINALPGIATLKYAPQISTGNVGAEIATHLQSTSLIPTFSFIDPFGYKGLSLGLVRGAIKDWGSDCVFFFNYNRINAGISNPLVDQHISALFGEERAAQLRIAVKGAEPVKREALVLEQLAQALKALGGRFVLPFRFRNENGTRSTHHLIFVSKHVLGYEKMKEIMAKESSTHDQGVASLEYSPADASTPLLFSLQKPIERLGAELLDAFAGRNIPMLQVYNEHHVDTPFIKRNYKDALLELESKALISAGRAKKAGSFADDVVAIFPPKPKA